MHMGKKPVLGLVGLAWLGLAVGGCKSSGGCDCDKSAQQPKPKRADNGYARAWGQPKPQNATAQQTQPAEGTVASKGVDPRAQPDYDYDPSKREPTERGSVARQIQDVPGKLPADLSPESTAVLKKPAGTPELVQTGRTPEPPTGSETSRQQVPAHNVAGTEKTVPPQATPGPDLGEVRPHPTPELGGAPEGTPVGMPANPLVEKTGGTGSPMPPPPPTIATTGTAPAPIREVEPATLPTPTQMPTTPPTPPAEAGTMAAPVGGPTPPAPTNPLAEVPPPGPAIQKGVKDNTPPLPPTPEGTKPLPTVQPPYDPGR
jgi:hypothetical protein